MAAADCSKTPRSKSIKARALTLRDHEARKLAEDGRVLIVREVMADKRTHRQWHWGPAQPISGQLVYYDGGAWDARVLSRGLAGDGPIGVCPLGPVGSPLWGREKWAWDYGNGWAVFAAGCESPERWKSAWQGATSLARFYSRFPRLRHESCEVKRAQQVTENEAHESGAFFATHVLYNGALTCDDWRLAHRNVLEHYSPGAWDADPWLWCSLVVDLDRLEVADA